MSFSYSAPSSFDQGLLASSYTNALTDYLQGEGADYVAFLAYGANGLSVEEALALKAEVEAGNFTLSGLFGAAQSKVGEVAGESIADPAPTLTVGDVVVSLSSMLTDLDTATWSTSVKRDVIYHTREFYSESTTPAGYDSDWSDPQNQPPTADPIVVAVTEYDEHATANANPVLSEIDLLTAANATDPDSDTLSVVADSVKLANGNPLPDYITYADGTLSIDTNHPSLDSLYKDDQWNVAIKYEITDGSNTIENTVALTINGTADQFHYTFPTGNEAKVVAAMLNTDGLLSNGLEGSFNVALTGVDADAFDFSSQATVSVAGDINKINGSSENQEWVGITLEPADYAQLGPMQYGDDNNKEGPQYYTTDTETMAFASADNLVSVTYNTTDPVNGGTITVTVSEFDYWL